MRTRVTAPRVGGGVARDAVHEAPDRLVDHDRLAGHRQVAGALEHEALGAGEPGDRVEPLLRLAPVRGSRG